MSRYINEDEILKRQKDVILFNGAKHRCFDTTELAEVPTADVVEVVRCKDCKFRKIEFGWNGKRYKMCANTDYPTDDDAYCSYGERREDGDN